MGQRKPGRLLPFGIPLALAARNRGLVHVLLGLSVQDDVHVMPGCDRARSRSVGCGYGHTARGPNRPIILRAHASPATALTRQLSGHISDRTMPP